MAHNLELRFRTAFLIGGKSTQIDEKQNDFGLDKVRSVEPFGHEALQSCRTFLKSRDMGRGEITRSRAVAARGALLPSTLI